eukprot:CAMPEP_0113720984 /NCGR_PEP_ID=MMETSP0038_2-20120614/36838_1 /TAXON_ID=2898 /ORGANISM="Cryptomonas paramecium" /LENGTH=53 /DNA_ID=CAMNT_0000649857 /DNA_START=309 /DNA_END=466 /DNA_ORIENTATION=+ /assembly_acc=CAM_ASM_000170
MPRARRHSDTPPTHSAFRSQTQEMLDYCAAKGIVPDVQLISPKDANHAMVRTP